MERRVNINIRELKKNPVSTVEKLIEELGYRYEINEEMNGYYIPFAVDTSSLDETEGFNADALRILVKEHKELYAIKTLLLNKGIIVDLENSMVYELVKE